jgi:hypothetical protein
MALTYIYHIFLPFVGIHNVTYFGIVIANLSQIYPPNATAVPSSYFPDEYQVGYGGSTPSTSYNSYIIKFN